MQTMVVISLWLPQNRMKHERYKAYLHVVFSTSRSCVFARSDGPDGSRIMLGTLLPEGSGWSIGLIAVIAVCIEKGRKNSQFPHQG